MLVLRLCALGCAAFSLSSCSDLHPFLERGHWVPLHHTVKDLRDMNVVKQQEDYSCGAAALATLLVYYFGDTTSEKEILSLLEGSLTASEKDQKSKRGFSLLDLKRVAEAKGYRAAGFKVSFSQLAQAKGPVIVFLQPRGYKHFAVYRGLDRGRVYLADPARGNLRMSIGRFLDEWQNVLFVLAKPGEPAPTGYPLALPHPLYAQPEVSRFNGQVDIGMMLHTLPQR